MQSSHPKGLGGGLRIGAAALLIASSLATGAGAQEPDAALMDERAVEILKSMSDYLAGADTLSVTAETLFDRVDESGIKIKVAREVRVELRRPDRLRAVGVSDDGTAQFAWFDGSRVTVWRRHANQSMSLDFSGDNDALLDLLSEEYDVNLPLADLLYSDPAGSFGESMISAQYVGERMVDGVRCHHLSFESNGADWQVWVRADSTPLPLRFAITYVAEPGEPEFLARLGPWSIGGELADTGFAASLPADVTQVEFGAPEGE